MNVVGNVDKEIKNEKDYLDSDVNLHVPFVLVF
jgi:hypothetical protein